MLPLMISACRLRYVAGHRWTNMITAKGDYRGHGPIPPIGTRPKFRRAARISESEATADLALALLAPLSRPFWV
jgi:hypothetical protein